MIRCLITLLLALGVWAASAQPCGGLRYQQRVFPLTVKTSNVVYGNAPSLPAVYLSENITQNIDLKLDVWEPMGDTLQKRPLVILAFGGAFLIGSKEDEDMRTIADSLAHRGYVTASINYRLGMNVVDGTSAERAIYRAMQDYSAAVRYFKQYATQYRIDTNYIYAGGVSAGGFAAMYMALVDDSDRPQSSFGAGGFNLRPDLGCKDCSGNNFPHSSNVRGLINYWGAIGDVNWIKPGKTLPLLSIHGDQDLIVPYNTGFPFTALFVLPQVSGSGSIKQRYDQIGGYNLHYKIAGEGHNTWGPIVLNEFTPAPNPYFQQFYGYTADFLFDLTKPDKAQIAGADSICPGVTTTYSAPASPGFKYCWQIVGGQIVSQNGHQVAVIWQTTGTNSIAATPINHLDAVGEADTFLVWVHTPTVAEIESPPLDSVCEGASVQLLTNTVASYYQWSPAAEFDDAMADTAWLTPLASGYYYLYVVDANGCESYDSINITTLPLPSAPTISQLGDSLLVGATADTIYWYSDDSVLVSSGPVYLPDTNGTYYAIVVSAFGCQNAAAPYLYIEVTTGMVESDLSLVRIYPNPFQDSVVVESLEEGYFALYNMAGFAVYQSHVSPGHVNLWLFNLPAGLYFYKLETIKGTTINKLLKF